MSKFVAQLFLHYVCSVKKNMETKALKKMADKSGYKYNHLATVLGISGSTFSRYMSGAIPIPSDKRDLLVQYLTK